MDTFDVGPLTRAEILKLPLETRNRILAAQVEGMIEFYENDTEWREWCMFGECYEYDCGEVVDPNNV